MEAVGFSVLSAVLDVVFDRIAPNQKFLLGLFPGTRKLQLNRLEKALNRLKEALRPISVVLEDAENKQGRSKDVKSWFNSLKHAVHQSEDLLDEMNTERLRVQVQHSKGNSSDTGFSDQFTGELSPRLEDICDALENFGSQIGVLGLEILYGKQNPQNREDKPASTSVVIQSQIFGRDDEKDKIIQMVLSGEGGTNISVIPITGKGGIGKTTLAQLVYSDERVYNDEKVKSHFETRAWVCVSEQFDVYKATKDLLMEVNSSVVDDKDDLNRLQVKLKDNLKGKRFIIILDDIWSENYNDYQLLMIPLKLGSRGSKIIVTTRNEKIALMLQNEPFHRLQPIPDNQSWSLFKLHAIDNRVNALSDEFETIGKIIVENCKGLPLAIKTIAGAMRSKNDIREWRDISCSDNWMVVGDILPALSLSYNLLPSHLKCCFAFCAVFPKDVPFDKEELTLLWMANDLIQPFSQKVAHNYFEELRSRSFFEMVNNKYLMHDLVNDLARIVSGNFCARIKDYQLKDLHRGIQMENSLPPEVLHFSYLTSTFDTLRRFEGLAQVQGLRTFLPFHQSEGFSHITTLFFSDILPNLQYIRALSLHQYLISVIPDSIGDLKHLRFLNLARNPIKRLPNAITQCLNLQTLILAGCWMLEELPEEMGLLVNLQHLDISGCWKLEELPEDIGLLINLYHLDISCRYKLEGLLEDMELLINLHDKRESWLRKLKDVQNLAIVVDGIHGSALDQLDKLQLGQELKIYGLDSAVTVEMAKIAELKNKNCIENLILEWIGIPECSEYELNIFSKLIPHTNIRQLSISGYRGTTFSNWLWDPSFCNIECLTLKDCKNCFHLPPLGQLTGLKTLKISGMDGIIKVGEEFYGNSTICKPFLVLEELIFSNMAEWTTWNTQPDNTDFLSLKKLRVTDCPKLFGDIPFHLTSLRTLQMKGLHGLHCNQECSFLSSTLEKATSSNLLKLKKMTQEIDLEISDCPTISLSLQSCDVEFLTNDICNSSLQSSGIYSCGDSTETIRLFSISKLQRLNISSWESPIIFKFLNGYHQSLTSLQTLNISQCNNLCSFPKGGLLAPNLKYFRVTRCNKLKSLPEMHTQLPSLRYLMISNCPEMECFPDGGFPPSLDRLWIERCKKLMMFQRSWGLQKLPSLTNLVIIGFEDKIFPEEEMLPSSLQDLQIRDFSNMEALNHKGLQHLTSLESLDINSCPKLRYLPEFAFASSLSTLSIEDCPELRYLPEDGLASSLSELHIFDCPKLKPRIEREKGEDWPTVSHIPVIVVDCDLISNP